MPSILIKGGKIFDRKELVCKDIFVKNGKILKIEPRISEASDYVFDATGKLVLPGLVDAHVHIDGVSPSEFSFPAELSSIPFGVTAVCDAGGVSGDGALLDSYAVKTAVFISYSGDAVACDTLLEKYGERAVGVKLYFDTALDTSVTASSLWRCCEYARKRGLRVMVHSSNSPIPMKEIVEMLDESDIITHAYHGGKNGCEENGYEALLLAKERGVIIDAGLAGHIHTDFGVFGRAVRAGFAPDIISSDITKLSAYTRGGRYGLPMCMSIAKELGMSELEIFKAVTEAPSRALGRWGEWGRLSLGGCADIAVFDCLGEGFSLTDESGNHIESKNGYRPLLTVSDGRILYKL